MKWEIGKKKNYKREITLNFNVKHIAVMFIVLVGIVLGISYALIQSGLVDTDTDMQCADGTTDKLEKGKEYYCGVHYSELEGSISPKLYNYIKRVAEDEE